MRYLSCFSGIEAASVAWEPLGFKAVGFSEIESFPCAVLKHRFPKIPNYGDITKHTEWNIEPGTVDLLVGGSPCQAFSVAGLRKGLADPRGNLALTFLGLADRLRPKWILWENVPGVLSSNRGSDFASFIGALGQLGYGYAWRVLDAQHFGVPQRRARVFLIATSLGDSRVAAEVLSIGEGLRGYLEASQQKRKGVAADAGASLETDGLWKTVGTLCADTHPGAYSGQDAYTGRLIPCPDNDKVGALCARDYKGVGSQYVSEGKCIPTSQPIPIHDQATRHAGKRGDNQDGKGNGLGIGKEGDPAPTLTKGDKHAVAIPLSVMSVRRLTPKECERLQGFPDDWTLIPWKGKPADQCPDGPRYKACGNSMAVPCMAWIGKRLAEVHARIYPAQ